MSKERLTGIKIPLKLATLHSTVGIPGGMPDLLTINKDKAPNVKAFMMPQGLLLEAKPADKSRKTLISAIVPFANVKVMVLEDAPETEEDKAA